MHEPQVIAIAREMRCNGIKVHVMANALGVSAGWASKVTGDVRRDAGQANLLSAAKQAIEADWSAHAVGRARRLSEVGTRRAKTLESKLDELMQALKPIGSPVRMPNWRSAEYRALDRLQQQFAKDAEHPLIGLIARDCQELLSHLIEWKASRHRQTQDKSDESFIETAKRVHDYVMREQRPPSVSDRDLETQEDARWLWRWKANANGRSDRKRNIERAELFCQIAVIVEKLMSTASTVRLDGVRDLESGRWSRLFNALMSTKNDYQYARSPRRLAA
ncbi:MAG: hypothetical protein E6Q67_01690 [Roseateles sp.]|nr:MAG: hypothetical protein E6Q67_01690 [Roseateles sp.]